MRSCLWDWFILWLLPSDHVTHSLSNSRKRWHLCILLPSDCWNHSDGNSAALRFKASSLSDLLGTWSPPACLRRWLKTSLVNWVSDLTGTSVFMSADSFNHCRNRNKNSLAMCLAGNKCWRLVYPTAGSCFLWIFLLLLLPCVCHLEIPCLCTIWTGLTQSSLISAGGWGMFRIHHWLHCWNSIMPLCRAV